MNKYLVAAYAVMWIILLAYVFILGRKYKRVSDELQELKRQVEQTRK